MKTAIIFLSHHGTTQKVAGQTESMHEIKYMAIAEFVKQLKSGNK